MIPARRRVILSTPEGKGTRALGGTPILIPPLTSEPSELAKVGQLERVIGILMYEAGVASREAKTFDT